MVVDLSLLDRLDAADETFLEEMTRRTPGGRVIRQDGLLLAIGSDPSPVVVNTILPIAPTVEVGAVVRAVETYTAIGHLPSIMTRDHHDAALTAAFRASGYRLLLPLPGMILEDRVAEEAPPDGVTLHRVETELDRQRWVEGNLHGFAEDDGERSAIRSAFTALESLVGDPVVGFYAMTDGRPVASAMALVDHRTGIGVVGWVGTDVGYRRRGIGRAVTLAASNAAFDLGATLLSLQASPMGLPIYERLGYRTVTGYEVWLPPDG